MSIEYLTLEELLCVHRALTLSLSLPFGVVSRQALEDALARPALKVEGYEPFSTLEAKAAVFLEALIREKPFLKANQATAVLGTSMFLRKNGYTLRLTLDDKDMLESVKLQQLTQPHIANWLLSRMYSQE